jgi:16S rRNA (cytidine1402-2'-O)-methyltransferase
MASGLDAPRGTLYVVGTPIGNLEDVTLRALRILREVALIAAEDTRHTRRLLSHYDIQTPTISYREQNRVSAGQRVLACLSERSVALVSDAGMPAIADPGADLIARVVGLGGRVEVIPGPSAALAALVGSGLPVAPFTFVGFLSRQRGDRLRQLAALATRPETLVFYEAPHRLRATMADLLRVLGDRPAAVCRELTKVHEEVLRAPLSALIDHVGRVEPRGEYTLVVHGAMANAPAAEPDVQLLDLELRQAMRAGADMRAVVADLARRMGLPRRAVYARWQTVRREGPAPE